MRALEVVADERMMALIKHGVLKPGADRWSRLIAEEWQEVEDELHSLHVLSTIHGHDGEMGPEELQCRDRAIVELAQLSQLCIAVIELLQQEGQKWVSQS